MKNDISFILLIEDFEEGPIWSQGKWIDFGAKLAVFLINEEKRPLDRSR